MAGQNTRRAIEIDRLPLWSQQKYCQHSHRRIIHKRIWKVLVESSLNNWGGITIGWNTSALVTTCSQFTAISTSVSEGLARLSRQNVTNGKCFNPYCDLPGSNSETWTVSKLFTAETPHWFTCVAYLILSFPMTKELDNIFHWCHYRDNIWCCSTPKVCYLIFSSLLLNLSPSNTFGSSSEILTFSNLFPSQPSNRKQRSKTPFSKAKAYWLDLSYIWFYNEIPEVQFKINTHSFHSWIRYTLFLQFPSTLLDHVSQLNLV